MSVRSHTKSYFFLPSSINLHLIFQPLINQQTPVLHVYRILLKIRSLDYAV